MTSERVTGIMLDRAENGQWNGSRLPIGYKLNRETMTPERIRMKEKLYS